MPNKETDVDADMRSASLESWISTPLQREDDLLALSPDVLALLLRDHTTGRNIFWATHDYETLGSKYDYHSEILPELLTGKNGKVICPRVLKSKEQQTDRVKDMAEVFTPSWVVKMMVDYVEFDVNTRCLELTCGEAPFLVSRYDATTGEPIAINERVGILDRKLYMVNNQQLSDEEWLTQVRQAFQSTYGYEWQGDSLLLARENLLYTFMDYYKARYNAMPDLMLLQEFAEIISWNLWQMDGLTYRIPREKKEEVPQTQLTLFDEAPAETPPPLCVIMDWQKGEIIKVFDIKRRKTKNPYIMKFDVIIGNPPYQEETASDSTRKPPIFNFFMDEAYKNANKVSLITPARFLFNAGYTPKIWDKKMLNDKHLKIQYYEAASAKVFANTDIKGGVVITYHDSEQTFEPIGTFTKFKELNSILQSVKRKTNCYLESIISSPLSFQLSELMKQEHPELIDRLRSSAFEKLESIFLESPRGAGNYIAMIGLLNGKRVTRFIRRDYVKDISGTLDKWSLLVSKANGAGQFGEILSTPIIAKPGVGYTQTFIAIGKFDTQEEVENTAKYIKSKFARAMLGILKITQDCPGPKWAYVPLQDFTSNSDIDWSKSIAEIDEQLFDKYGLDEKERNFIRTKVKEMV
jgi:type II restriction enzyme